MTADGLNYAPVGRPAPVCSPGDFVIAAVGLDHGHINGMCNGLIEAGGQLRWVYDRDPDKLAQFCRRYPGVQAAPTEEAVLVDDRVHLVASAAIPALRAGLGLRVMAHGKHYFTDKPPMTTLAQLAEVRAVCAATGRRYAVYFSERLHVESAVFAGQLISDGAIGRVVQVLGMGPHRVNAPSRPAWFFDHEATGGILCDIGSHQLEQVLYYGGCDEAVITAARVANYAHKEHPGFEDFGDVSVVLGNGVTGYCRVDWLTPAGLGTWGDGRTFILGTEGYIELRKYTDVARESGGDHVYLVDQRGEQHISVSGRVGYPFFGQLILDCIEGTKRSMSQEHAFRATELCLQAQAAAARIEGLPRSGMKNGPARLVDDMTIELGRIGIWRHLSGLTPDLVTEVEALGYGAIWVGGSPDGDLGGVENLLATTDHIAVATGIVNVWKDDAATVAASYHRITARHPGRFLLGLGIGHPEATQEYQRPYAKLVSYLDELDELKVPADGRALAALGPRVLRLAADRSAGAHPYLVTPEHTRQARQILGPGPLLAPEQKVVLETDPERARAIGRPAVRRPYLGLTNYVSNLRRLGWTDADLADGGSDALIDALVVHGDAEALARGVTAHLDAGADQVAVQVLGPDPRPALRALAGALGLASS